MFHQPDITSRDFFSNPAAREAGFTEQFWYQAYLLYQDAANQDPDRSLAKYDRPRSIRMPFGDGHVDVIVRVQPESREHRIIRLTAYPAEGEDGPHAVQTNRRWYVDNEKRPVLGEGAFLDENVRW